MDMTFTPHLLVRSASFIVRGTFARLETRPRVPDSRIARSFLEN